MHLNFSLSFFNFSFFYCFHFLFHRSIVVSMVMFFSVATIQNMTAALKLAALTHGDMCKTQMDIATASNRPESNWLIAHLSLLR